MLLQLCNIVAGLVVAAPELKRFGQPALWDKIVVSTTPWRIVIGSVTLGLGALGLLTRLNVLPSFIPDLGASFPQSLPALAIGLLLLKEKIGSSSVLTQTIASLAPHSLPLGLTGMAVGLGSLLFGCFITVFCRVPF